MTLYSFMDRGEEVLPSIVNSRPSALESIAQQVRFEETIGKIFPKGF